MGTSETPKGRDVVAEAVKAFPGDGLVGAFAYGSGVFEQIAAKQDGASTATKDKPLVDIILIVEDAVEWHKQNLERYAGHYSCLSLLGPQVISKVQHSGGYMYFNTDVTVPQVPEVRLKYGVISQHDAIRDLTEWDALYLSGRLHKPVRFIRDAEPGEPLRNALHTNLAHAMHTAFLLMPERFSEQQLYHCISGLSYAGDIRMSLAENPDKVANIVRGSMPHFKTLYGRFLDSPQSSGLLGSFSCSPSEDGARAIQQDMCPKARKSIASTLPFLAHLPADQRIDPVAIQNVLRKTVSRSSRIQSAKGPLTAGALTAVRYGLRKVGKRFLR